MPNPSLPVLSPEALAVLREISSHRYRGPDRAEIWSPDDVELIEYVRLVHELNRISGSVYDLEVRLSKKKDQLEVRRDGEKTICLVPHPNRTLAVLRTLPTGAGVDTAWDAL